MIVLGIAFLIGGMAVSVGAPAEARWARMLAERGIDTTAKVTEVDIRRSGPGDRYAIADVEYRDELGLAVEANGIIYCGDPEAVSAGDEVQITYDPEDVAPPQFAECEQSQEIAIPLIIGVVAQGAGAFFVLRGWRERRWKRRWWGLALLAVGLFFGAMSFEDECDCPEFVYTGGALVVIGVVPLVAPRDRQPASPPGAAG